MSKPIQADAVEPTASEMQVRREECYELERQVKEGFAAGREAMWSTAKALWAFNEQQGWLALGYDRLGDWLADPEIGMTRRTFQRMVSTYDKTVMRRQIPLESVKKLDMSKVDVVLSKVETGEVKIEDALSDAETLGYRDLRESYWGPPEKKAPEDPPDDDPPADDEDASAGVQDPEPIDRIKKLLDHADEILASDDPDVVRDALVELVDALRSVGG
jgi:hypothetical protein